MFGATAAFATQQAPPFQAIFSPPSNSFSNPPGNGTFAPSNVTQGTTGNQQTQRSASVPRKAQGHAARGNPSASANQVTLFADEEQQVAENYMLIDKEENPSLVDMSITDDRLCMHPSPALDRSLVWSPMGILDRLHWALIDTGSDKNLASSNCWNLLSCKPHLRPPGPTRVIEGNNASLNFVGFMALRFQLAGHVLLHEFGVVKNLPVDIIIGGELERPHECPITYASS